MSVRDLFSLKNKHALITGGASGIGFAIAHAFAEAGAALVIADHQTNQAQKASDSVRALGYKSIHCHVDVACKDSIEKMLDFVSSQLMPIDILVNCAGVNRRSSLLDVQESDWDSVLGINLKGTFLCSQAVAKMMIHNGGGRIINLSSILGELALPSQTSYASSKGGVNQLTKVSAIELAQYNILVNAIAPSYIETPLIDAVVKDPIRYEELVNRNPMKRFGKPEEVAGTALFLASDAASFITGQIIAVDGGWTAC